MKLPILLQSKDVVDNVMKTCVGLHNMLFEWDALDSRRERDVDWNGADSSFNDDGKY